MTFTISEKTKILRLKSELTAQFSVKMVAIPDTTFQTLIRDNCIITGGAIASCFHSEKINDIDLYAKDQASLETIKMYILQSMRDSMKEMKAYDVNSTTGYVITDNAVTLKGDLQFIYLGTADQCRLKFDFIHCMPWFDIKTQKLYISKDQYDAIADKRLLVNPFGSVKFRRIDKYTKRGWTIEHDLYEQALKDK